MGNEKVWVVTYTTTDVTEEPVVTIFNNEDAAEEMYHHILHERTSGLDGGYYNLILIDEVPIYHKYIVYKEMAE